MITYTGDMPCCMSRGEWSKARKVHGTWLELGNKFLWYVVRAWQTRAS
jgi:hypothetical protein